MLAGLARTCSTLLPLERRTRRVLLPLAGEAAIAPVGRRRRRRPSRPAALTGNIHHIYTALMRHATCNMGRRCTFAYRILHAVGNYGSNSRQLIHLLDLGVELLLEVRQPLRLHRRRLPSRHHVELLDLVPSAQRRPRCRLHVARATWHVSARAPLPLSATCHVCAVPPTCHVARCLLVKWHSALHVSRCMLSRTVRDCAYAFGQSALSPACALGRASAERRRHSI